MAVRELIPGKKYQIDIRQGRDEKRFREKYYGTAEEAKIYELKIKKALGKPARDISTMAELALPYIQFVKL